MPNRIIKESVCTSETIDSMSWFEECFYHRLWTACDDYGRMDARPAILKSKLFPLKERLSLKDIQSALQRMVDIGCVMLYECDGKPYLYLPSWEVHQQIRAKKSKYPAPAIALTNMKSDDINGNQINAYVPVIQSNPNPNPNPNSNRKETRADEPPAKTRFSPPSVADVSAYIAENGYMVDAERFVNYYTSNGWKVGKNPMKDWKAAVRTWDRKEEKPSGQAESKPAWNIGTVV